MWIVLMTTIDTLEQERQTCPTLNWLTGCCRIRLATPSRYADDALKDASRLEELQSSQEVVGVVISNGSYSLNG